MIQDPSDGRRVVVDPHLILISVLLHVEDRLAEGESIQTMESINLTSLEVAL